VVEKALLLEKIGKTRGGEISFDLANLLVIKA